MIRPRFYNLSYLKNITLCLTRETLEWWSNGDFRFWNLDCGLSILVTNCVSSQTVLKSKIRILKSKM